MKKCVFISSLILIVMLVFAGEYCEAGWTPTKDITYVIHGSPGSGTDTIARAIQKVINDNKLLPVTLQASNKQGGQGGKARAYVSRKEGDPTYLMTVSPSHVIVPIRTRNKVTIKSFTPVANLCGDINTFVVRTDSPYKSFKEVIELIKKKPGTFTVSTSQPGATDTISTYLMEDAIGGGAKFKVVPMQASAKAVTALLGGHVDACIANPGEVMPQIEAGKFRLLAVIAEERHPDFPDVPSTVELGVDVAVYAFRGVVMPMNVPDEAAAYMEGVFKKAYETETFQKFVKSQGLTGLFMGRKKYKAYLDKYYSDFEKILKDKGLMQK